MIDWARVASLKDEVGPDCFAEIVEVFLEEVDEGIARLRGGVSSAELGAELHFLKGCALNLGFSDFSGLCQAGEAQCNDGSPGAVDVNAVLDCYDASRTAFLQGVQTHAA